MAPLPVEPAPAVLLCPKCGTPIKPGQLYVTRTTEHVACPTPREIAHARRVGRL